MSQPHQPRRITRRAALTAIFGGGAATAAGCASDGHFGMLGYSTAPNYAPDIRTVYVPCFKTRIIETTPYRGMEFTLTRKVVDAIESKTPMKVLSDPDAADTELQGTITGLTKLLTNRTNFNEVRELTLYLTCEIVWHDLRPGNEGKILTNPRNRDGTIPALQFPFDQGNPPLPPKPDAPRPVQLSAYGRAIPEVGESSTTAMDMAIRGLAVKIVSAMEQPW
jgi:Lipopolysaccharide-assembly